MMPFTMVTLVTTPWVLAMRSLADAGSRLGTTKFSRLSLPSPVEPES